MKVEKPYLGGVLAIFMITTFSFGYFSHRVFHENKRLKEQIELSQESTHILDDLVDKSRRMELEKNINGVIFHASVDSENGLDLNRYSFGKFTKEDVYENIDRNTIAKLFSTTSVDFWFEEDDNILLIVDHLGSLFRISQYDVSNRNYPSLLKTTPVVSSDEGRLQIIDYDVRSNTILGKVQPFSELRKDSVERSNRILVLDMKSQSVRDSVKLPDRHQCESSSNTFLKYASSQIYFLNYEQSFNDSCIPIEISSLSFPNLERKKLFDKSSSIFQNTIFFNDIMYSHELTEELKLLEDEIIILNLETGNFKAFDLNTGKTRELHSHDVRRLLNL
ncbi:MAG: hypothetical protein AAF702_01580 [Chloroflexota bacterium]